MEEQLSMFAAPPEPTGRELAQAGIERAVDHAEAEEPGWADRAFRLLHSYLAHDRVAQGPFMAEDVRAYAEERSLPAPPDPRAWGGIMQKASRAGLIVGAGYAESKNKQAHCRPTKLWERA